MVIIPSLKTLMVFLFLMIPEIEHMKQELLQKQQK